MTPDPISAQKPKFSKTRMMLTSMLVLLAVLLAACGNSSPKVSTLNLIASANGSFAVADFNPYNIGGTALFGASGDIYEPLVFENRYTGEIKPWLASNSQLASDAKSVTFTIRQGVKWTDGTAFTIKDVTFTLDMLKKYPALDQQGLYSNNVIASYSTPDQNTLKVTFTKPTSTALWYFSQTPIVQQQHYSKFADPTKATDPQPVGTGPFKLQTFNSTAYVLVKNPNYWQAGLPKVDTVVYHSVNDNTTAQTQITSGKIDWAGVGWSPDYDAQYINKDPQHYHEWFPGSNTTYLYLNLTNPMFQDVRVRQAISLGINRDSIIKKAAPYGVASNASGILLPAQQQYLPAKYQNPAAIQQDKDTAAKAASLLQQAGYTKGSDGIYQKDGQKLSFKMDVPTGWSDWQSALNIIHDSLKSVGIDAQPNALATPNLYLENLGNGKYQSAIFWSTKGPTPYFQFKDMQTSSNAQNGSTPATGTNYEHWTNPASDKLLAQYVNSADQNVQKQAIAGLADIMANQLPTIPLYYNVEWDEYTTTNFTGWPDKSNPYDYGSPFNGEDSAYVLLHLTPVQG